MTTRVRTLCWDTETTGFPVTPIETQPIEVQPRIIQLHAALVEHGEDGSDPVILDTLSTYIKGVEKIPYKITQINGVTMRHLENAPDWSFVRNQFFDMIDGCEFIVAHNAPFDLRMVHIEEFHLGHPKPFNGVKTRCTLEKSRLINTRAPSHNLGKLYMWLFNEELQNAHTAGGDVAGLIRVYTDLLKKNGWGGV